jgi:hypothetical protein
MGSRCRVDRARRVDARSGGGPSFLGGFWDAFPDGRLNLSGVFAERSVAAAEGRFIGTPAYCARPQVTCQRQAESVEFRWMSSYDVRGDDLASEHLYSTKSNCSASSD